MFNYLFNSEVDRMFFSKAFILITLGYSSSLAGKPDVLDVLPILVRPPIRAWLEKPPKNITLPCSTVFNIPYVSYSWEKNGDTLNVKSNPNITSNKDNGTITLINPTDDDVGRYQCFAEKNLRVATSMMIDIYKTYVNITKNVTTHVAVEGKPISLNCPVDGSPYPHIEWKLKTKNETNLTDIKKDHIVTPDGSIWLFNVTEDEKSNSYICLVTSIVTNVTEIASEHYIKVVKNNETLSKHIQELYTSKDKVVEVGKTAKLYCIFSGNPLPDVIWLKDNKRIQNSTSRMTIDKNRGQVLVINETRVEDEGTYTCVVRNKINAPRRHHIELTVVMLPTFENSTPEVTKVLMGTNVTITFSINSRPEPIIFWTIDAQPLFEESLDMDLTTIYLEGEPTRSHLTIRNVGQDHTAYYGCKAYNIYGEAYLETLLYVF